VADDLARWAAQRAPEVLARAEEEAVATLRDALVQAATGAREPQPEPERGRRDAAQRPGRAPSPAGDVLWAYCVTTAGASPASDLGKGMAARDVRRVDVGGLSALVSAVPGDEFGEERLRVNLNDMDWLERGARAHEAVLERALAASTIVPLRMCTIFEGEEAVRRMLEREHDALADALERLAGRQEWGVKLLVDPRRLADAARASSDEATAYEDELASQSGGGAYMTRRRLERKVREIADRLAAELADDVHARLQDWALDAVTHAPQNRELSGHEGEMLLNGAYLVEADRVDGLRALASELEQRHERLGARIELTGPWPPYNFVRDAG
jgi:Gas vesicle synthesis protein GvpL/GvpF